MMVNDWKRVSIETVYSSLYDGPHATPKPATAGPVFLGIKNITEDGRLDLDDIRHIAEDDFPEWTRRVMPRPGDIVFTYEATLNLYAIIPQGFRGCLGRRLALIRPKSEKVDTKFLFYYFFSDDWRTTISKNILSGSTVDRIPLTSFPTFNISLPPLPTQRKIAAILSAYDDLVENNTRRIAILEEMAQALYREWFVHFRFPGHEKNRMVESALGMIPEGWEVKTFGEVTINFDSKRRPLSSIQREKMKGEYPYYGAAKIFDYINDYIFDGKYLLIAEDGSVIDKEGKPVLQIAIGKFWANNHTHIIQGKPAISTEFLYLFMSDFKISGYVTGAAQPKITQANLNRILIIIPPKPILDEFSKIATDLLSYAWKLEEKNANLRQARDLLLPKLIAGEIDVERLAIAGVEETREIGARP